MELTSSEGLSGIFCMPGFSYLDIDRCPTGEFLKGVFPQGSMYNGMKVLHLMSPEEYVMEIAIPHMHPAATDIRIVDVKEMLYSANLRADNKSGMPEPSVTRKASIITTEYRHQDRVFIEKTACIIEDLGSMGGGMWRTEDLISLRAVRDEFLQKMAVLAGIGLSFTYDKDWLAKELKKENSFLSSPEDSQDNSYEKIKDVQNKFRQSQKTLIESMFSGFLEISEAYDPLSGRKFLLHDYWKYWWLAEDGSMICSNDETYMAGEGYRLLLKTKP
jgi:hypothetical protein